MAVWIGLIALGLGLGSSLFLPVPQNLRTNFEAGKKLYAAEEYEGAILEFKKVVSFKDRGRSWAVRTDSVRWYFEIAEIELPIVAAAWYKLGECYKESDRHEEAVEAYRQVMDVEGVPEDFRSKVQFEVAETRFFQKEYGEAVKEYKKYVELYPGSYLAGKAFFYSGWSEFNLKQYDQTIATLQAMLEGYPEDKYAPDSQFRIASSYYEKGDYQRAVGEAQLVLDNYPNSPVIGQAVYLKANAYDKLGRDEEAIATYREVRDLYDRMFELLRGSFREGKNLDFESYLQLFETSSLRVAEIYRKTNQYEKAYKELIAAQETAEARDYKAKVQMRMGDNYLEWERYDNAYNTYNQVIELYSDTSYPPNAQYYKGEARYYGGDFATAREEYLKVLEDYPDSDTELRAAALYTAAWSSEKLAEPDEALKYYSRVVDAFPRSEQAPRCLLRIAWLNQEQQRIPEALKAYEKIAESYNQTPEAADAYYGLGRLYRGEGRLDEAVEAFSKVGRNARETYIAALIEAANIHIKEGRSSEGKKLLEKLLEGVTGDPGLEARAHFQMAQLDLNNKNYVDALSGYTRVIEEYPASDVIRDVHYGRGLAYHYVGRYDRALADYQWLLDTDLPETMQRKVEFSMALSYSAQGKDARAKNLLNDVIEKGDESLARSARLQLISMAEKRDPEEAIKIYEELLAGIETEEEKQRVLIRLASAYFRLNQFQKSIETTQELIDLAMDIESISNAMFIQGNSYYKSDDYVKAIEVYRSIMENYPQIGWAKNALFQIGICYQKLSAEDLNLLPSMSATFKEYYTKYPEDERAVHAYYYDAWARYRLGKWRDASGVFVKLSSNYPKSKYADESLFRAGDAIFNLRGKTVEEKDQNNQEAMALYQRLLDRYPRSQYADDALYNKAWCLINLDRTEEGIPIFEEIVTRYPDGRYGARSQFTLGDYYYGLKEYEQATTNYQKFLALFPEDKLKTQRDRALRRKARVLLGHLAEIDAYNLYAQGEQLFDSEDYDEARKIFKEVQEKYPDSDQAVNAALNIGASYMAEEDYRKAGAFFTEVVEKYSDNSQYQIQVDFAKQQLETLEEARVL
jgi:tetratricopeptide (TPR) repeat protein